MEGLLTTADAARELALSRSRVLRFIEAGRLPATKYGRDWFIHPADLDAVRVRRAVGRPPKERPA